MQTILHVIDTTGPGGAETVYLDLVRGLDATRFRSIVTTGVPDARDRTHEGISRRGWLYDELAASGIAPLVLPTTRAFDLRYLMNIVRAARRERADVIHAHLLTPNVYCAAAALIVGIPMIATFHGAVDIKQRPLTRLKLAIVDRGASRIAFVSDHLRREILAMTSLDPEKAVVVHNGIDTTRFARARHGRLREQLGWSNAGTLVGAVGNLRPTKGYDVLLDAAAQLIRADASLRFVIVGDDTEGLRAGLEAQRTRLGLEEHVRFIGFGRDVPALLNGVDVFVLPSRSEGFSLSTIEAMACELPVVVTRSGGPEEIVDDGVNGLMVPPDSPSHLADAIARVVRDYDLRRRLAEHARAKATEHFAVAAMVRRYAALYAELHR